MRGGENERSPLATAAIVAAERVGREVAERTSRLVTLALAVEQERREAAECALALATTALAAALKRQVAAERTSAMAISMLANVRKRQQAAKRAQMSANIVRSLSPTLPHPMSYVGAILSAIGGTASRRRKSFSRQRLTSRPPSRSIRRLADANGLVAALVVARYLGHPIRQMRPFPPTLYHRWGGHQR